MNPKPLTPTAPAVVAMIAVAAALLHLVFGVYYATHAENLKLKPSLRMIGQEYLESFPGWGALWEGDQAAYNREALGVLQTGLPRNRTGDVAVHAVVYDYFVAGCYWIGGVRLLSLAIPQALLAGLVCYFAGMAAFRIAPKNAALASGLAALMVLGNLRFAMYVGFVLPTDLLLFFVSVAFYAATGPQSPKNLALFVGAIGAAVFTQAAFFVVASAATIWLALESYRRKETAPRLAALALAVLIGTRLAISMVDHSAGTSTDRRRLADRGGILWEGNNPNYESMRLTSLWERRPGNPWTEWRQSDEEQERYNSYLERADQDPRKAALLWVRENPGQYAKLCVIRLRADVGSVTGQMSPRQRILSTVWWLLVVPASLYGLWVYRAWAAARLSVLAALALFGFSTVVIADWYQRYRLPIDLMLTVFAAITYATLIDHWREREAS